MTMIGCQLNTIINIGLGHRCPSRVIGSIRIKNRAFFGTGGHQEDDAKQTNEYYRKFLHFEYHFLVYFFIIANYEVQR